MRFYTATEAVSKKNFHRKIALDIVFQRKKKLNSSRAKGVGSSEQ
jgi:hypothetical protein